MSAALRRPKPRLRRPAETNGRSPTRVLMLHGMGGGMGSWDALSPRLAPHLELWDINLPWSIAGDPAWARETDVHQWVADPVKEIRPDVVVAHSFAANVILEMLTSSELLSATPLVLISPFCRGTSADLDWDAVMPGMQHCFAGIEAELRHRRGSKLSDEAREALVRRAFDLMGEYPPLRFYEMYGRTPQLDLESITTPLLLVGGSDDPGAIADGVRVLGSRLPRARLEILDGCGHFPMAERAPEVAALIADFIDHATPDHSSHFMSEAPQ